MIVVSDTSPLNYLILVGCAEVLPELYGRVVVPAQVLAELQMSATPEIVRTWIAHSPKWLEICQETAAPATAHLHPGEAAAIALAMRLHADLLLVDDRDARAFAESAGLRVTGLLGVLRDAAIKNLVDIRQVFETLRKTSFRAPPQLYAEILLELERRRDPNA